jgi:hypothetical protein
VVGRKIGLERVKIRIDVLVKRRAGMMAAGRRKFSYSCRERKYYFSVIQPVASSLYGLIIQGSFQMFPELTKECKHTSYIFFKRVPLCKYTLLIATVKV